MAPDSYQLLHGRVTDMACPKDVRVCCNLVVADALLDDGGWCFIQESKVKLENPVVVSSAPWLGCKLHASMFRTDKRRPAPNRMLQCTVVHRYCAGTFAGTTVIHLIVIVSNNARFFRNACDCCV